MLLMQTNLEHATGCSLSRNSDLVYYEDWIRACLRDHFQLADGEKVVPEDAVEV